MILVYRKMRLNTENYTCVLLPPSQPIFGIGNYRCYYTKLPQTAYVVQGLGTTFQGFYLFFVYYSYVAMKRVDVSGTPLIDSIFILVPKTVRTDVFSSK